MRGSLQRFRHRTTGSWEQSGPRPDCLCGVKPGYDFRTPLQRRPATGFSASAESVFPEDERHAIFLPNTTVTWYAILVQDRLNLVGEANPIARHVANEPCSEGRTNEDGGNQHHDNARSTRWGSSVEHKRHISIRRWDFPAHKSNTQAAGTNWLVAAQSAHAGPASAPG